MARTVKGELYCPRPKGRVSLMQLEIGTEVELEHTKDRKVARCIALAHLQELPDYYTRLRKMERSR